MIKANFAVSTTLEDRLVELGGISRDRVRLEPTPGTATADDLVQINKSPPAGLYELRISLPISILARMISDPQNEISSVELAVLVLNAAIPRRKTGVLGYNRGRSSAYASRTECSESPPRLSAVHDWPGLAGEGQTPFGIGS